MITELRTRLGTELDRLSHELVSRSRRDPAAEPERSADPAAMEIERLLQHLSNADLSTPRDPVP